MGPAIITPPTIYSLSTTPFYSSGRGKKGRKLKKLERKLLEPTRHLSYPKSAPTPLLLTNPRPTPKTKLEALNGVVNDLEDYLKKCLTVEPAIFASLLEICYQLNALEEGARIHQMIPGSLLRKNKGISAKLVRLYAASGSVELAHQMFDQMPGRCESAFPWNSLIAGYSELGMYEDALALYFQMEEDGVAPDEFTFPRVLKACGGVGLIGIGQAVHRDLVRMGFGDSVFVRNALVDMYAKCGEIVKARRIFDGIGCKDAVPWNSMLTGYIRHGLTMEAIRVFRRMVLEGVVPDSVTLSTMLAHVSSSHKLGEEIHGWTVRRGVEWDLSIANSLIVMYSNYGRLDQACWLFDNMPVKDLVSWNSIIYALRKDRKALPYFESMERAGLSPDGITFVAILSACASAGLVKEGERLFLLMKEKYGLKPSMEHYACMVNLYGRAGLITEAYDTIIERMHIEAGPTVWGALFYACYLHKNDDIGEVAAEILFELEPDNELNFELLMKIYEDVGRLEDVERVRTMMVDRGL